MRDKHTILIGKTVKKLARLRGGGTALPGLIVEKIDKGFVARMLKQLPQGVIVISGTNGKTTTTKMVVELLKANGLQVFTNKTGSNFIRGIGAALLGAIDNDGKLPHDIAVLELDEAHATHFVKQVSPRYVLVLNVMRDQLDRFGEIDHTAKLLTKVAAGATEGVVLNRDDPRVAAIADSLGKDVRVEYFSASTDLLGLFVNDDALHSKTANAPVRKNQQPHKGDVVLESFKGNKAVYSLDGKRHTATMQLTGVYNFLNAAGALALASMILGERTAYGDLVKQLGNVAPAFGRGETIVVGGQPVEMVLVKNPSGFRLALQSFSPKDTDVMIAVNDMYADGRDMSWLWDVDFTSLAERGVAMVSGIRAYDMALRLQYDDVTVGDVETDLRAALPGFIKSSNLPKRIFCTYTSMLKLRRELKKYAHVEGIDS
jgi:lipid II isoglutaminyl synthase (glutamine-hydrolysing)